MGRTTRVYQCPALFSCHKNTEEHSPHECQNLWKTSNCFINFLPVLKEKLTSPSTDHSSASIISPAAWHQLAFVPLPGLEEPYLGTRREFTLYVESLMLSLLGLSVRALVTVPIHLLLSWDCQISCQDTTIWQEPVSYRWRHSSQHKSWWTALPMPSAARHQWPSDTIRFIGKWDAFGL